MKTLRLFAVVLVFSGLGISPALAANKEGAKCTTAGKIVNAAGKKLVCAKVAKTLKWINISAPAATTTTVAPTTTIATTTTTTTIPLSKRKPVVTLMRSYGTAYRSSVSYIVESDKPVDCYTLSRELGEDFVGTRISRIDSIGQPEPHLCVVEVQAIALADGDTREIILAAASTFSIVDRDGNIQTTLLGSPQSIWVTRPVP
ncbi:MAG: hypothetical protein ACKORD_02525 [Acidimicrobiaceae bacterium]